MYVCLCRGITDHQIRQAVSEGASSVKDVNMRLGTGSQCGKCTMATRSIVKQALSTETSNNPDSLFYKAS